MTAARHRSPRTTGRLRLLLAVGGVLALTVGSTTAAMLGGSSHILVGDGAPEEHGLGYADVPTLFLSDGDTSTVVPAPVGRDHNLTVTGPTTINRVEGPTLSVKLAPSAGVSYALNVTPTLSSASSALSDPFQWLRFTVTAPDGTVWENLSADEFNALADRSFRVCNTGCGDGIFTTTVTLSERTPITFNFKQAQVRVTFEGMTAP